MPATAKTHAEQMAAMRRSFAAFQAEISEFSIAAARDQRELMARARELAHAHLDAYFDATYAAGMSCHDAQA